MKETATLIRIGLVAAGVLGSASVVLACDGHEKATRAACSATSKTATVAPCASQGAAITAAGTASTTDEDNATAADAAAGLQTPAQAGMRAYIDPETGTLGGPGPLPPPSAAAVKALEPTEEPVETVMPDGSVMVDLKGRGQEYFILQLDDKGQRHVRCVDDPNTALQTPPAAKREER